jgi:PAS domain-containing protein
MLFRNLLLIHHFKVAESAKKESQGMDHNNPVIHKDKSNLQKAIYVRNLIEASLDPLLTIDTEGKLTDVNSAAERATGLSRDKLMELIFQRTLRILSVPKKAISAFSRMDRSSITI